ncbi:MAG: substrate-binding domain-containing protein [Spirochaetales bacterium]|nr:substrate-binding domain-containing protein [Spirochaetales bacterium]
MPYKRTQNRPTIGLFIDWAENPYHIRLIAGITNQACKKDINLFTFVGGCIHSTRGWEKPRNIIYEFVKGNTLDGLIISSGSIGHYCTTEDIKEFANRFSFLPTISISQNIPGIPSIIVDNRSGLKKMIRHLIEDHHYKRIAMITGPPGNQEAELRFRIYRETLRSCGMSYNKDLVAHGDFMYNSGKTAMNQLLSKNISIDALISANDDMAFGAMEACREHQIYIPRDFAIVGFDDLTLSRYTNPPLTTVKQPIYEQGTTAVEMILELIEGKKIPLEINLPTELILRESCGCLPKSISSLSEFNNNNIETLILKDFPGHLKQYSYNIVKKTIEIHGVLQGHLSEPDIEQLLSAFYTSIKKNDPISFLNMISILLEKKNVTYEDEPLWQNIISEIRKAFIPYLDYTSDKNKILFIEDLFHAARIKISDFIRQNYGFLKAIAEKESKGFRDISEELVSIVNMEDILVLLTRELNYLGIKTFVLSLYEKIKTDTSSYPAISRLIFAYEAGKNITGSFKYTCYPTEIILPNGILSENKSYSFYIEPIFFGGYQLGFALFELGEKRDSVYNIMRKMFLNSALKAAIYVKQVQLYSVNLETQVEARTDALSKANRLLAKLYQERKNAEDQVRSLNEDLEQRVLERTAQLESTNTKLKNTLETLQSTQDQLVQSEKMAALGSLVAGIAHEINTPIGIGVTAASHMDIITKELVTRYKNLTMTRSDLEKYVTTSETAAAMILVNLRRANELIRSFKKIAVDQSSEVKRQFNVKEYIDEILLSLQPKLKKTSHTITVNCPRDIIFDSYPGPFSQIITNLVMNSLLHGYNKHESGNLSLTLTSEDNKITLTYSDDGKGIPASHMEKIFDPFFTTKRNQGGTGLGLHLLYNIVTQTFGGSVKCSSKPDAGTTFTIILPRQT